MNGGKEVGIAGGEGGAEGTFRVSCFGYMDVKDEGGSRANAARWYIEKPRADLRVRGPGNVERKNFKRGLGGD